MGFALRIAFVDVVCDNSLKNVYVNGNNAGFEFDIRLAYYRGHYLSCIDLLEVYVDGEKVPEETVRFGLNGKEFSVCQLKYCFNEFWRLRNPARISVIKDGGLNAGKHHIEIKLMLRVPYMALGGDHNYMPLDSCGEKTLEVVE
ncbi:hypothetical protein DFR58_13211 [Anaerobacterium chartisolvens]|uniref:C-deglycosylation enzyme beta subunit n=1 Tax=Anaerobacterium chartisolvens TaxID=1297424 RepID=A0A369AP06_9FIRM|nr:DUF6379 domain-containing protein [Anaerobacterium chartisolvens]RCX09917.1 hypothetical protein DFR58_13211 [Anaerobacterium chartisolvens]